MLYKSERVVGLLDVVPPPYLVEGLIRQHTITLFSSEPHTGKTMMMLYLMICMEHRIPVLGTFDVPMNTSSMFIALDSPRWDVAVQFQKLIGGLRIPRDDAEMMDSRILGRGSKPRPNIMHEDFVGWLKELRQDHGIDTFFIDTTRRIHHRNENDSGEMGEVMERFENFVDEGKATILLSTHTSKPTGVQRSSLYNVRGSSVISGSADFHYSLGLNKKGQIIFDGTSKRRGENRAKGVLTLEFKEDSHGLVPVIVEQDDITPLAESVFQELLLHGQQTGKELAAALGGKYYGVQRALRKLQDQGRVRKVSRGVWGLVSV